jgi:hypothetical protein
MSTTAFEKSTIARINRKLARVDWGQFKVQVTRHSGIRREHGKFNLRDTHRNLLLIGDDCVFSLEEWLKENGYLEQEKAA